MKEISLTEKEMVFLVLLYFHASNFLLSQIILPTRISSSSALIDNIFCNLTHTAKSISGNLTSRVSNHLHQFLIFPEIFSNAPPSKYNTYTHDLKKIDEEKFIFGFNCQDWDKILVLDKENVNETITVICRILTTYWKNMHV